MVIRNPGPDVVHPEPYSVETGTEINESNVFNSAPIINNDRFIQISHINS